MIGVSNRHFGGVTGDVMGATNDLTRMASLITILAVVRWL
jgi:adenosylcobinamide-GDP ribazoletransferase